VTWDGADDMGRAVPSGMYFYRLETAGGVLVQRVVRVPVMHAPRGGNAMKTHVFAALALASLIAVGGAGAARAQGPMGGPPPGLPLGGPPPMCPLARLPAAARSLGASSG